MDCQDCQKPISGNYFDLKGGKTICSDCYESKYRKTCDRCCSKISGTFYNVDDKYICRQCYQHEVGNKEGKIMCNICKMEVDGKIIRSAGVAYHEGCFRCCECRKDLSEPGLGFTTDSKGDLYCQNDYNEKFAPRCFACNEPIAPKQGQETAQKLTALDHDWHPSCFKCQDCKEVLDSTKNKSCFPIDKTPLCKDCNLERRQHAPHL